MNTIRIALADDHLLFRKGLMAMLNTIDDFEIVGDAPNGKELINIMPDIMPDVVLLDLQMPVMDGVQTAEVIHARFPNVKMLVVSMHEEDRFIIHLLEKGVHGYILKDSHPEEVENAIRRVLEDGFYYSDLVGKAMHRKVLTRPNQKLTTPFNSKIQISQREMEVLQFICEGFSTIEIGDKMFVSPRTVEGHRLRLLEKTETKNVAALVAYAFKNDLI